MAKIERYVLRFAGLFVFSSAVLAYMHRIEWLYFTMFVGLNLFQYSFTGFCPLRVLLSRIVKE